MGAGQAVLLHGKYCGACGIKLIDVTAGSCPRCQASFSTGARAPSRSRITAALLAFLFGGAGAHRFYLGQPGLGLLHVLFAWSLIPGLVSFVDFIRLLAMPEERFAALHGRRAGGGGLVAAGAVAGTLIVYGMVGVLVVPAILETARATMP